MMAKKIKKIMAMVLALCICFSALPLQALAADGTVVETKDDVTTTVTTKTETTTDESGNTTVVVTIDKTVTGTNNKTGVTFDSEDHSKTTTVTDSKGKEVSKSEVNQGRDEQSWDEAVELDKDGKPVGGFSVNGSLDVTITDKDPADKETVIEGATNDVDRDGYEDYDVKATDKVTVNGSVTIDSEKHTVTIAYKKDDKGNIVYKQQKDADGNPVTDADGNPVYEKDAKGNLIPEIDEEALYCPVEPEDYEGKEYGGGPYYKVNHNSNPDHELYKNTSDKGCEHVNGTNCSCCAEHIDGVFKPNQEAYKGYTDEKPTDEGFDEGFDMVWTGSGEGTDAAVSVWIKYLCEYEKNEDGSDKYVVKTDSEGNIAYKRDAQGKVILDENNQPIPIMVRVPVKDENGQPKFIYEYEYEMNEDGTVKTDENGEPVYKLDDEGKKIVKRDEWGKPIKKIDYYVTGSQKTNHAEGMVSQASQFVLKHENGNYFYAYCMDANTGATPEINRWYHVTNIENAIYDAETNPDGYITKDDAERIKKIATYGYWGTDPIVYEKDEDGNIKYQAEVDENGQTVLVPVTQKNDDGTTKRDNTVRGSVDSLIEMVKRHYYQLDENGNYVVDENGNRKVKEGVNTQITVEYPSGDDSNNDEKDNTTNNEDILKVIDGLTEAEALAVTQAAIWYYSNKNDVEYWRDTKYGAIFEDDVLSVATVLSAMKLHNSVSGNTGTYSYLKEYVPYRDIASDVRLEVVFNLLLNIQDEDVAHIALPKGEETTVIPNENVVTGAALVIKDKVADADANKDDDGDNDVYNTDLNFTLAFVPTDNDDMMVYLYETDAEGNLKIGADGKPVIMKEARLDTNAKGENGISYDAAKDIWTFTDLQLQEGATSFDLQIQGTQHLSEGVYIYQAHGGRKESQTLVGLAAGKQDVAHSTKMTIEFSVDEERHVVAQYAWYNDGTKVNPPQGNDNPPAPPQEPPQVFNLNREGVVEIIDEQVPLAAAPKTGDASFLFIALALFAAISLCAANFDKKRKHETF